jgi:hypothetical protein
LNFRAFSWEAGKLEGWEARKPEGWEAGRQGSWKAGRQGSWKAGKLEGKEAGRQGSWKAGKLGGKEAGMLGCKNYRALELSSLQASQAFRPLSLLTNNPKYSLGQRRFNLA